MTHLNKRVSTQVTSLTKADNAIACSIFLFYLQSATRGETIDCLPKIGGLQRQTVHAQYEYTQYRYSSRTDSTRTIRVQQYRHRTYADSTCAARLYTQYRGSTSTRSTSKSTKKYSHNIRVQGVQAQKYEYRQYRHKMEYIKHRQPKGKFKHKCKSKY